MIFDNAKMFESVNVLSQLEEKGMLGYAISRNRRKLIPEVQEYSQKRDELLKKHGVDIGEGRFQLPPENAARFFDELRPFSELTVDVDVMQVSLADFCGGNLTTSQMEVLDWMVKE